MLNNIWLHVHYLFLYGTLSYAQAYLEHNYFVVPPEPGIDNDFTYNNAYPWGSQHDIQWRSSWENLNIKLYQNNNENFWILTPDNFQGSGAQTFLYNSTFPSYSLNFNAPKVFFFRINNVDDDSQYFSSHYFNLTDVPPLSVLTSSSVTPSTTPTPSATPSSPSSTRTATPTATSEPSQPSGASPQPTQQSESTGISAGAAAGIGVGVALAVLGIAIVIAIWLYRRHKARRSREELPVPSEMQAPDSRFRYTESAELPAFSGPVEIHTETPLTKPQGFGYY